MARTTTYIATLALLSFLVGGCPSAKVGSPNDSDGGVLYPQAARRAVDLLVVIDNSATMAGEQANWRSAFPAYLAPLKNAVGGLPDLHVGVISTDLGTGPAIDSSCDASGDGGRLTTRSCTNPVGAPYIVDVEPRGCEILMEPNNFCSAHTCSQAHCAHEPSTTFVEDSTTGCPRCRNYAGESVEDVFACMGDLGTMGCNWEQPLEALYQALDPANTHNAGFFREEALLGILIIADEDDCSASDPQLYGREPDDPDGPLGPHTSFRCFEAGVTCDVDDRWAVGTRENCVAREDPESRLHPVSRYVDRILALKDPLLIEVAVLSGPVVPSAAGDGFDVEVQLNEDGNPEVQYSCTTAVDGAWPGIRLHSFAAAFQEPAALETWAYTSVCEGAIEVATAGIAGAVGDLLGPACLPAPPAGCADVGVEFGAPQAPNTCAVNEACGPDCTVTEIRDRGLPSETRTALPACLSVMADGSVLPDNTDRTLAYATGHPDERDASLPVEACWHLGYQPLCPQSNFAELIVSRRNDPPLRTVAELSCPLLPRDEVVCDDGLDDDEDCLVDQQDPCCLNAANCVPD